MLFVNAERIRALAPLPQLIECLLQAFRTDCIIPLRQVAIMPGGAGDRSMLCMPAFDLDGAAAVKLVTVFPDNAQHGVPNIQAAIVVFSRTGTPIALLDGTVVTHLRTAAVSALACRYLSRADSAQLVVIGTGALAPAMAAAHCVVRPIERISVCGRHPARAAATVASIRALVDDRIDIVVAESVAAAVATADIVCCATSSATPVLIGKWLKAGTFVDLVGGFSPHKREADDDVMVRSRIFVDTLEGALAEAGDIIDPLTRGVIERSRVEGELADLARGRIPGRLGDAEIIVFKAVGTALADLAASRFIATAAGVSGSQRLQ